MPCKYYNTDIYTRRIPHAGRYKGIPKHLRFLSRDLYTNKITHTDQEKRNIACIKNNILKHYFKKQKIHKELINQKRFNLE